MRVHAACLFKRVEHRLENQSDTWRAGRRDLQIHHGLVRGLVFNVKQAQGVGLALN